MKLLRRTSVAAERLRLESEVQFRRSDRASDRSEDWRSSEEDRGGWLFGWCS